AAARAEHAEEEGDRDRRDEETDARVDPEREGDEGTGEGDMAEGVGGEQLGAHRQEVADEPGRHCDGRAGDEPVPDEGVAEHVVYAADRVQGGDHGATSRPRRPVIHPTALAAGEAATAMLV